MVSKRCVIPVSVGGGCVLVVIIVLLSTSIKSVEENHVAIVFDNWSQTINEDQIYKPGIYAIGPTKSFISYPTTFAQLSLVEEETVVCRTKDGMPVSMPIQITYQYDSNKVIDLYKRYTDNFDTFLYNISKNVVRDSVNKFVAQDLQLDFESVKNELRIDLAAAYTDIYLIFQSIDVTIPVLPEEYKSMLTSITELEQIIEMKDNTISQLETQLQSDYNISVLEAQRQIMELEEEVVAQKTEAIANYQYECTISRQESISLKNIADTMAAADDAGTTDETNISKYKKLAVKKALDQQLNDNTEISVLLGSYDGVVV